MSDFLCNDVLFSHEDFNQAHSLQDIFSDDLVDNLSLEDRMTSYKTEESSTKTSLTRENIYIKPKTFVCYFESCRKEFAHHHSLQKHERIHRGEKPYVCKVCGHAFTQHSNLKRHERLHTGERPYVCPHCPKTFANNSNLKQHVQIHEDNKLRSRFVCSICSRFYYYQSSLKKHLKEHQQGSEEDLESPSTVQSEVDIDPENNQDCIENEIKKKVKLNSEKMQESNVINYPYRLADMSFLPTRYQELILNKSAVKQLQRIVLGCAVLDSTAEESFGKILQSFKFFFDTNAQEHASTDSNSSNYSPELQPLEAYSNSINTINLGSFAEFSCLEPGHELALGHNNRFEDTFLKDEYDDFLKDDDERFYYKNKNSSSESHRMRNYFDETYELLPFCKAEETF